MVRVLRFGLLTLLAASAVLAQNLQGQRVAVSGTLRELGEKDLYLETANREILKFRLVKKTEFRDRQDGTIRDSLLNPGDQLSVQVSLDDPETAVQVIFTRFGTQAERAAAEAPFDHSSAKVPAVADTRSPAGLKAGAGTNRAPEATASANPRPPAEIAKRVPGPSALDDATIAAARDAADRLTSGLPNFIVQQSTTRYYSSSIPAQWRVLDVATAEVVSMDGKEDYRNILVNGKPSNRPVEKTGAWSTGEFQTTLESLFSRDTATEFRKAKEDTLGGRPTVTYDFRVREENSNWDIYAPDGSKANPGFSGTVWIDRETRNVLRIEEQTGPMPAAFPYDKVELVVEYGFIRIGDNTPSPLPVHSQVLTCQRGSPACTKNEIHFQNYRKFTADSSVTFGK